MGGEVLRARVADRNRGVGAGATLDQERGERLPDEVRAPDDHDVLARGVVAGANQELLYARRRARFRTRHAD
jgi:hypothetical protein